MATKGKIVELFRKTEGRIAFELTDGTKLEGYFSDFDPDGESEYFEFFMGGPLASNEPMKIKISDVVESTIFIFKK